MMKLATLVFTALVLSACTVGAPQQQAVGCIPGDPGGSPACQQIAYTLAR